MPDIFLKYNSKNEVKGIRLTNLRKMMIFFQQVRNKKRLTNPSLEF
jgi:hypothetical protein